MRISFASVLAFLTFSSCNVETDDLPTLPAQTRTLAEGADNPANPFDYVGSCSYRLTEHYLVHHTATPTATMLGQWQAMCLLDTEFASLAPTPFLLPTAAHLDSLVAAPLDRFRDALQASSLGAGARDSLTGFLTDYMERVADDADFGEVYDFVVAYEGEVMKSRPHGGERRILLAVSSVARHSYHLRKKKPRPRDRDWDILWTNFTGVLEGIEESDAHAIAVGSVAAIALNE